MHFLAKSEIHLPLDGVWQVVIDQQSPSKSPMIALEKPTSILNFVTAVITGLSCMTPKASNLGKTQNSTP